MTSYTANFIPQALKTTVVQVHGYEDKNFMGTLYHPYYTQKKPFSNLTQLLLLIEALQDDICYPQKGMETRYFPESPPSHLNLSPPEMPTDTVCATFQIKLLFRQNASWQGGVTWVEKGLESQFRSALELVMLMDSVLN